MFATFYPAEPSAVFLNRDEPFGFELNEDENGLPPLGIVDLDSLFPNKLASDEIPNDLNKLRFVFNAEINAFI